MADFFYNLFHLYDAEEYQALSFTPNTLRIVFLFIWIGIIAAMIGSFYSNYYLGTFVKKLIDAGASNTESAKTLDELGLSGHFMLKFSLREGSVLRKTVLVANSDNNTDDMTKNVKNKENINELQFYIPEEAQPKAQNRFRVKGNTIGSLIFSIVIITLILILLLIFGPWLLHFVDNAIAMY